jgi:hypothetical protein
MQKLSRISSGQNNKSCRIIHHESKKIGFAFFRFFCDFLRNLQESANPKYYLSCDFVDRPLIPFDSYAEAPTLQLTPWKETQPCNVTPMGAVAGAVGKIRRGPPESRPGKGVRRG